MEKSEAWRALANAARLISAQRGRLVLTVDSAHHLASSADRNDLERLLHLVPDSTVTLVCIKRNDLSPEQPVDALPIRLRPLTRTEAGDYLTTKLRLAGRDAPTFGPGVMTCLQSRANGVPRTLDRLSGLALRLAAIQRLKLISTELVETVAQEIGVEPLGLPYHERLGRVS